MIYFIQQGDRGPIKIGFALDPAKRLAQLQTANHEELRMLKTIPGDKGTERFIHGQLSDHRIKGEWFEPELPVFQFISRLKPEAVEYEILNGRPYAVLWRETERSPTGLCPFCFCQHRHGLTDGHRVAHCTEAPIEIKVGDITLCNANGYIIRSKNL